MKKVIKLNAYTRRNKQRGILPFLRQKGAIEWKCQVNLLREFRRQSVPRGGADVGGAALFNLKVSLFRFQILAAFPPGRLII